MPVRIQRNRISCVLLWGCKIIPLWETIWQFLKEITSQLSYDRYINGILQHLSWGKQNTETYVCMFTTSFVTAKTGNNRCESINVQCYIYTVEYLVQFSSVTQSCPTLCHPIKRSTPSLPVHHQLPDFTQTHVHRVSDAIQPSHPLSFPSPPAPNPSQHQSLFQ